MTEQHTPRNVGTSQAFELDSLSDLARMLAARGPREQAPSILLFNHNSKFILGTISTMHGWYDFYGLPIFIYVTLDEKPKGHFLQYESNSDKATCVDNASSPGKFYFPIIKLKRKPEFIEI